ncbi:MAG TPA: pyridoxal-phosphate dependent enzyme [Gemmatimonadales bacterium]|nr:pyridoxal-phosphate dependent enzyme [Gemmatimonadales bacterium]
MAEPFPERIPLDAIRQARTRIKDTAVRTPLIRFPYDGPREIWLKLEMLQPVGSFKIRGARNAIGGIDPERLKKGCYTASAGNMALGLAWCARERNVPFTAIVPDHAPATKLAALDRLGAKIIPVTFERWWQVLLDRRYDGAEGVFVHPVADPAVMAGNATVATEILEDLPHVEKVLVPFGGGGLACGISSALKALEPGARLIACEIETAAPLTPSLEAGSPQTVTYTPSFVDGAGSASLLPEMWPMLKSLIDGSAMVSLEQTAEAIRILVERMHIVAEGAGALPLAAALSGKAGGGTVCCVISGGNIDPSRLAALLTQAPGATGPNT